MNIPWQMHQLSADGAPQQQQQSQRQDEQQDDVTHQSVQPEDPRSSSPSACESVQASEDQQQQQQQQQQQHHLHQQQHQPDGDWTAALDAAVQGHIAGNNTAAYSHNDMNGPFAPQASQTDPYHQQHQAASASWSDLFLHGQPHNQHSGNQDGHGKADSVGAAVPAAAAVTAQSHDSHATANNATAHPTTAHSTTHSDCPSATPLALDACPDETCTISHLALARTLAAACCGDVSQALSIANYACTLPSHTPTTSCCPPPQHGHAHAQGIGPCSHSALSCDAVQPQLLCTDDHCSDPACNQGTASTSTSTLQDICGSCDGAVAAAQSPATVPAATKDAYDSFQELLNCCYCSDGYFDSCCSPHTHDQDHHTNPSGTATPTTGVCSTPTTFASDERTHPTTPHSHFDGRTQQAHQHPHPHPHPQPSAYSHLHSEYNLLDAVLRDGCKYPIPHNHDDGGLCVPPQTTLWNQTASPSYGQQRLLPPAAATAHPTATIENLNCKWAGCPHTCHSVQDLVQHVNEAHLVNHRTPKDTPWEQQQQQQQQQQQTPQQQQQQQNILSAPVVPRCQWDACADSHDTVPMPAGHTGQFDAAAAILQHLLQAHLGGAGQSMRSGLENQHPPLHQGDKRNFPGHTESPLSANTTLYSAGLQQNMSRFGSPAFTEASMAGSAAVHSFAPSSASSHGGDSNGDNDHHACGWIGCDQVFTSHEALTEHVATHHVGGGKSKYVCGWVGCQRAAEGKTFQQRQKILRHIQTHTGDRPFKCTICSRRFSEANTLSQHMRTHTREKPYVCDYPGCGAAFAVAGSLTIHKRSRHTLERPFVCTWPGCGRAFAESSNLTKHRRVHSGERPFPCKLCERKFSRPDQLARHMKVHDNQSTAAGSIGTGDGGAHSGDAGSKKRKADDSGCDFSISPLAPAPAMSAAVAPM